MSVSLYYFTSQYCGPCKKIKPWVNQLPLNYPINLFTVDIDQNPQTAAQYNAVFLPTLVWYQNGQEVNRQNGAAGVTEQFLNNLAAQYTQTNAAQTSGSKCPFMAALKKPFFVIGTLITLFVLYLLYQKYNKA